MEENQDKNKQVESANIEDNKVEKNKKERKTIVSIKLTTLIFIILVIAAIVTGIIIFMNNNNNKAKGNTNNTTNQLQATNTTGEVNQTQNNIATNTSTNTSNESSKKYQLEGTYYREDAEGDEPAYIFSDGNKVQYGALWMCYGTYKIEDDTIKISFNSAVDPDGKQINDVTTLGVKEKVELSIVNSNKLKDETAKEVYIKNKAPAAIQKDEIKTIVLEGVYGLPNSDGGWAFTKDGKVANFGNVHSNIGKYSTTGKDSIEMHYTKKEQYDDNGEKTVSDINVYESATIENNDIYIKNTKLEKYNANPEDYFKEETITSTTPNSSDNDEKVKELFEKGSAKIRETQYSDYHEYAYSQPSAEKTIIGKTYRKRDVLYADVEKEYAKIFTGEALRKVMAKRFTNVDGYLYVRDGGATGWNINNIRLTKVSETSDEIKYTVKYNDVDEGENLTEKTCNMTVKLVNGEYRISSTDYCNL